MVSRPFSEVISDGSIFAELLSSVADIHGRASADGPQTQPRTDIMSLSALPALNVAQNSLFNELAQINNSVTANAANSTVLASSPQGSAAASDPSSSGG